MANPTEAEMMADLQAADAAGDTALAQHIADRIKAVRAAPAAEAPSSPTKWTQKAGEGMVPGFNRLVAAGQAAIDPLIPGRKDEWGPDFGTRYAEHLRAEQGQSARTQTEHPIISAGLQTAGAAPTTMAMGGPLGLIPSAAGGGAMYAAGDTRAETVGGQLKDTAIGAGVGTAAAILPHAAMTAENTVRRLASPLEKPLTSLAESAAVRSANADRTATRRAFKGSDEARHRLGRFMLDENVSLRSPHAIRDSAQEIAGQAGPEIGALAKQADASGTTVNLKGAFDAALADPRVADLGKNVMTRNALGGHSGHGHSMGPPGIRDAFADWLSQHGGSVTPSTAHDIRMQLDNMANWDQATPKQVQKAWRAARDAVDSALDSAMAQAGMGGEWASANARFSQARKLSNPSKRGLADVGTERREGNRLGSPSEKAAGIAGAITAGMHNPVAGVALPVGTVLLNRYTMPVTARSADAVAQFVGQGALPHPSMRSAVSPAITPALLDEFGPNVAALIAAMKGPGVRVQPGAATDDRSK